MSELPEKLRRMAEIATSALYSQRRTIHEAADEIERLQRELDEAKEFRAILEGHLSAAIDDYNDAQRQAFIEAAEIVEAPGYWKEERAFREVASRWVVPTTAEIAAALRAKAEGSKE